MEKTEQSLYIKVLVWAYKKQDKGFTFPELITEFNLDKNQQQWVLQVFHSNIPSSENLFDLLSYRKDEYIYVITAKGTSAAVDYLSLQEAKDSSKRAEFLAFWAIGISAFVGIVQIVIAVSEYLVKTNSILPSGV